MYHSGCHYWKPPSSSWLQLLVLYVYRNIFTLVGMMYTIYTVCFLVRGFHMMSHLRTSLESCRCLARLKASFTTEETRYYRCCLCSASEVRNRQLLLLNCDTLTEDSVHANSQFKFMPCVNEWQSARMRMGKISSFSSHIQILQTTMKYNFSYSFPKYLSGFRPRMKTF